MKKVLRVVWLVVLIIVLSGGISLTSWDQACEDATQCYEDMARMCTSFCRILKKTCTAIEINEGHCQSGICVFEFTIHCGPSVSQNFILACGGTPCPLEP